MHPTPSQLHEEQSRIAREITLKPIDLSTVNLIAGITAIPIGDTITAVAVIVRYPSCEVVEKKTVTRKAPMHYIPGLEAFREGPIAMEAYYELEYTPDVILVKGHGVAHPSHCGLASYIGVETQKPTIGVALKPVTEVHGEQLLLDGETLGIIVTTRQHANPLSVSPGNLITISECKTLVGQLTHYPHKLPEPLHIAQKIAKKGTSEKTSETNDQLVEEEYLSEVAV